MAGAAALPCTVPAPNIDDEELLASDGVTHVVRIGDTVRRPIRPFTATVHAYLRHLHGSGFISSHDTTSPLRRPARPVNQADRFLQKSSQFPRIFSPFLL